MTTLTLEIPDELANRLAPLHLELLDFLATGPSHTDIANFKFSMHLQERLEKLLDANREENLTANEQTQLDVFQQMNHLLILLKARVHSAASPAS